VMALGFAVLNRQHANPLASRGRINLALMRELNEPDGKPLHLRGAHFPWKSRN
jgi:hypothetical protein